MNDTKIEPTLVEGELRIKDTDLGQRLGFSAPIDIRKLIRRYNADLKRLGVLATVAKTSEGSGGRPATEFYLNRKQAIFVTAKSDTAVATDITIEIVERFDAYERGAFPKQLAERPWRERSVQEQHAVLKAAAVLGRFGNNPLALNYMQIHMGAEYFPTQLMPAYHQHALALETAFTVKFGPH